MRSLPVLLLVALSAGCTYTVNMPVGTVQFVDDRAPARVRPVVRLDATPTAADPTLALHLARRFDAPVYEADETNEVAREVSFDPTRPIAFLFDALFGDGLALLSQPERLAGALTGVESTVVRSTRTRGAPRPTAQTREVVEPWKAGAVTIEVDKLVSRWVVADDSGVVRINLADEIGRLPTYPHDAVDVSVSASTATERDDQTFQLDAETARALYLHSVDMTPHASASPPDPFVTVRVDERLLVVEVANRGGGATAQLRATLQSPLPELDGRQMLFGAIAPGRQRAWFTELPFGGTTRYAEIPIRIVFSEGNGFPPPPIDATLRVLGE